MNLEDLKKKKPPELLAFAEEQGVEGAAQMRRQELMFITPGAGTDHRPVAL